MTTKKMKEQMIKYHFCNVARIVACASFLMLAMIGVSSLVKAMTLEEINHENGIPAAWETASLGNPETITVPITYWDQRQDSCDAENRQFEWVMCRYWTKGVIQGLVKNELGEDGLPVPTFTNAEDAWRANMDIFSKNMTGNDPVQAGDNFYRWFHETDRSKQFDREVTFKRVGNSNMYTYGGQNIFPLDDVDYSDEDESTRTRRHNYHFTAHLGVPVKIAADGTEKFEFSGDDDVWVFLNGKLVLDIGGLHEKIAGSFEVNTDGTLTTKVEHVNDPSVRVRLDEPSSDFNRYVGPLNDLNVSTYQDITKTIDVGLKPGDVVNLDFFYAERSTEESNTQITISNMNWPISADCDLEAEIVGQTEQDTNLVEYVASIHNRDTMNPLNIERLAAFIVEDKQLTDGTVESQNGFIPLSADTLYYNTDKNNADGWKKIGITTPDNTKAGFNLEEPLTIAPDGKSGDTMYFKYYAETTTNKGIISGTVSFFTALGGESGVTFDQAKVVYAPTEVEDPDEPKDPVDPVDPTPTDPDNPDQPDVPDEPKDPDEPDKPSEPEKPDTPEVPDKPTEPVIPPVKPEEKPKPTLYNVVIHYVYEDGGEAADDYRGRYAENDKYNIASPKISGYVADLEKVMDVMGGLDVEFTVTYKPVDEDEPKNEKRNLIIHYVYNDGTMAKPDYTDSLNVGEKFEVDSPTIENYTADFVKVGGVVADKDLVYVVTYSPVNMIMPDVPLVDNMPNSDIMGDLAMFGYVAPLGEVAYVPNTGIVSSALAPLFEQYFADVILSQGFILVILLIFSISFAVYFSLRRYRDLDRALKIEKDVAKYSKMEKVKVKKLASGATKSTAKTANKKDTKANKTAKKAKVEPKKAKTTSATKATKSIKAKSKGKQPAKSTAKPSKDKKKSKK